MNQLEEVIQPNRPVLGFLSKVALSNKIAKIDERIIIVIFKIITFLNNRPSIKNLLMEKKKAAGILLKIITTSATSGLTVA